MGSTGIGLKVFMLPWLAHGHISPFLELAKRLSKRNFTIYLCSTPINFSSIRKKLSAKNLNSIQLVELHLPEIPELPPQYHTTNGLPPHLMPTFMNALLMARPTITDIVKELKPDLFIYDALQQWAGEIAFSLNIPSMYLITTSATMVSFFSHMMKKPGVEYPIPSIYLRGYEKAKLLLQAKEATRDSKPADQLVKSDAMILVKTFREMEGNSVDYFASMVDKKVVSVGPLVEEGVDESTDEEKPEVIKWLDGKEKASSVFVSFGSEYFLSKEEMEEIAHGLENSNVNFVWVVRFPNGVEGAKEGLPEGFIERVRGRGMILEGWAPQMNICDMRVSVGS